jgi:hypothetical protein
MIARELHVINLQELEVVQVADSVFGTSDDSK